MSYELGYINNPIPICKMLNYHYNYAEFTTTKHVLQVETVGDKYMAVSGLPTKCENHAANIAHLALDIVNIITGVNAKGFQQLQVGAATTDSLFYFFLC